MKQYYFKVFLFLLVPLSLFVLSIYCADGTTDIAYVNFVTPKQKDLILGCSRASVGLQPDIMDSVLNSDGYHSKLYNYSFTSMNSPYGPAYYESIKRKLIESTTEGIYLLIVDPWCISSKAKDPNDPTMFEENNFDVGKTKNVSLNPNIEYLVNSFAEPIISVLIGRVKYKLQKPERILHKNGWLEHTLNMDSSKMQRELTERVEKYKTEAVPYYHYSSLRYSYLQKTIEYLRMHGEVYLIRLPVHKKFMELDDSLMPQFDSLMTELSKTNNIGYINLKNNSDDFEYSDGLHIYKTSSRKLSIYLGMLIVKSKLEKQ